MVDLRCSGFHCSRIRIVNKLLFTQNVFYDIRIRQYQQVRCRLIFTWHNTEVISVPPASVAKVSALVPDRWPRYDGTHLRYVRSPPLFS